MNSIAEEGLICSKIVVDAKSTKPMTRYFKYTISEELKQGNVVQISFIGCGLAKINALLQKNPNIYRSCRNCVFSPSRYKGVIPQGLNCICVDDDDLYPCNSSKITGIRGSAIFTDVESFLEDL